MLVQHVLLLYIFILFRICVIFLYGQFSNWQSEFGMFIWGLARSNILWHHKAQVTLGTSPSVYIQQRPVLASNNSMYI